MFKNMDDGDIAIVNIEDEGLAPYLDRIRDVGRRVLHLGLADDGAADAAFVRDGVLTVRMAGEEHALVRVDELRIVGVHNVLNALAASAAALACGASVVGVCSGLREFKPLPHRLEPVDTVDGVRYVNDSKATNTDAVLTALAA
ncbi:MAG: Mur ligase family protein [Collinsella intestinalis]